MEHGQALAGLHEFEVISNTPCAEKTFCLTLAASELASAIQPGQFMNLEVPGDASHILRIPLSFSRADAAAGTIELIYAVVGEGTERLSKTRAGERASAVGPLGRGWQLPEATGRALLVAGGVGLPPIVAAAGMLAEAGIGFDVIVGAQTAARHVEAQLDLLRSMPASDSCDCERKLMLTTDDGSRGRQGFTTEAMAELLGKRRYAHIYSCGPTPMMAGVARLAAEHACPCQVSLEQLMGCGFGACSCCNVSLREGAYALCCKDGPVFNAKEVAW